MRYFSGVLAAAILLAFVHLCLVSSISALPLEWGQLEPEKTADAQVAYTYLDQSAVNLRFTQNDQEMDGLATS